MNEELWEMLYKQAACIKRLSERLDRIERRMLERACPNCGYIVRGVDDMCPQCGRKLDK